MPPQSAPRLVLTDADGRLRLLAVHESGTHTDVYPVVEPGSVEDGPLPRLSWPVPLADGRVLVSATTPAGQPALYLLAPGRRAPQLIYRPPPGMPAEIAPGVPHYANPSPDGRAVTLATPGERALVLLLLDLEIGGDGTEVLRGAPLFSVWSPRGDVQLIHAGPTIHRMDRTPAPMLTTVGLNSVDLRVPAWSPDGQLFATIRHGESRNAVVLLDRDGRHAARIGAVQGTAALGWSPRGDLIGVSPMNAVGAYSGIDLIDVRASETRTLVKDRLFLWAWSPDGRRIAYLRPAGTEGQIAWRVVSLDGRPPFTSAAFYPGPLFLVLISFFDQYLQTHRLWSPDGRYLVAAGRIAVNGPPSDLWGGNVLLLDASGKQPLAAIARGEIAAWLPG